MTSVRIIGKKGSRSRLAITKGAGIPRYNNSRDVSVIINYGLAGKKLDAFLAKNPKARRIPMINQYVGKSKYGIIKDAEQKGILVPDTKAALTSKDKISDWIEKKHYSIGGIGIKKATKRTCPAGKYFQKFISDRKYELRVHAFLWQKNWHIQKRVGDEDTIAWNYKNGGKFINVNNTEYDVFQEALEISKAVLDMRKMAFGAVDFLVDRSNNVYFIEVNSAPGFTEFSEHIYIDAFTDLKKLTNRKLLDLCC